MSKIDAVVIGTSAGGVEALKNFCRFLPSAFHLPVLIVQHFPETSISVLPSILARECHRNCKHGTNGETIYPDTIYIAPPGQHMLVHCGVIRLARGPKENGNRPAIDPLFRSAAAYYGPRLAAVLLTGLLYDGSVGMASVKSRGGIAIVQDPEQASYGDMPRNAMSQTPVDYVGNVEEIVQKLTKLADADPKDPPDEGEATMESVDKELSKKARGPSGFTCPECHGALYEFEEGGVLHYRCRVGHAYSAEKLLEDQGASLEAGLWAAVRALEESNELIDNLIRRARAAHRKHSVDYFENKRKFHDEQIALINRALEVQLSGVGN